MMMKRLILIQLAAFLFAGCAETEKKPEQLPMVVEEEVLEEKVCSYTYDPESVEILWKAYKYTEQVGVNGAFMGFELAGAKEADSPEAAIEGASAIIDTKTTDSGDPTRDPKIIEFFFSTLENGEQLNANVYNFNSNEKTVDISIDMNGQSQTVSGTYGIAKNILEAQFEIDVNNWGASIEKLNEVCEDLHKGADGKSILWPNVTIYLICGFNENCE